MNNFLCHIYHIRRFVEDAGTWTVGWVGRTKNKISGIILAGILMPFAMFRLLIGRLRGHLDIPYMDLVITTRCTLRCLNCSNLIEHYGVHGKASYDIPLEQIRSDVLKLLDAVEYIGTMTVLGGEPLLHKDIASIVEFLLAQKKIGHIQIITNGTLKMADKLLKICSCNRKKLGIVISDYSSAVPCKNYKEALASLTSSLKSCNAHYKVLHEDFWRCYGGIERRGRSPGMLTRVFRGCRLHGCRSLLDGKLHFCPYSSAGVDLGLIKGREGDFVSIRRSANPAMLRTEVRKFLSKADFIDACDYCDNSVLFSLKKLLPAEQSNMSTVLGAFIQE
jgi:hypothetical protein